MRSFVVFDRVAGGRVGVAGGRVELACCFTVRDPCYHSAVPYHVPTSSRSNID